MMELLSDYYFISLILNIYLLNIYYMPNILLCAYLYFLIYLELYNYHFQFYKEEKRIKCYLKINLSNSLTVVFEWHRSYHVSYKPGLRVDSEYMLLRLVNCKSQLFRNHFIELIQSLIPMQIFSFIILDLSCYDYYTNQHSVLIFRSKACLPSSMIPQYPKRITKVHVKVKSSS